MNKSMVSKYVAEELNAIRAIIDKQHKYKEIDTLLKRAIKKLEKQ